jgi:hypothetical protein
MRTIDSKTYEYSEWLRAVFAHPVQANPWYWDCDFIEPDAQTCVDYLTRLFREPQILDEYLDEQVRDGLYFLISNGCSMHSLAIYNEKVPLQKRADAMLSMYDLFSKFMNKRCSAHLSHLDQAGANPINSVTYMWWDIIPFIGHPNDRNFQKLDEAALEVMESTLELDSIACQENALHGLGHWHMHYPGRVEKAVEKFLKKNKDKLSKDLENYARAAARGCVN